MCCELLSKVAEAEGAAAAHRERNAESDKRSIQTVGARSVRCRPSRVHPDACSERRLTSSHDHSTRVRHLRSMCVTNADQAETIFVVKRSFVFRQHAYNIKF